MHRYCPVAHCFEEKCCLQGKFGFAIESKIVNVKQTTQFHQSQPYQARETRHTFSQTNQSPETKYNSYFLPINFFWEPTMQPLECVQYSSRQQLRSWWLAFRGVRFFGTIAGWLPRMMISACRATLHKLTADDYMKRRTRSRSYENCHDKVKRKSLLSARSFWFSADQIYALSSRMYVWKYSSRASDAMKQC